ncbi:hypothetical protein LY78DRAFT_106195 [Colletotrichum sublineola]|nr:hypothetical protein LY78DRAFT_106195 [Colletotrichum sublineola]
MAGLLGRSCMSKRARPARKSAESLGPKAAPNLATGPPNGRGYLPGRLPIRRLTAVPPHTKVFYGAIATRVRGSWESLALESHHGTEGRGALLSVSHEETVVKVNVYTSHRARAPNDNGCSSPLLRSVLSFNRYPATHSFIEAREPKEGYATTPYQLMSRRGRVVLSRMKGLE